MFDVKVLQLMEASGQGPKYDIWQVYGYVGVGSRVCDRHQKIFNLMNSLTFFVIVVRFPQI